MARIVPLKPYTRGKDVEARRILSLVFDSRQAMHDVHEGWFHDIQFFRGFQWTYRDRNIGRIQQIPRSPWRPRLTDNQTRPLVTQMLALLTEKEPTFRATPRSHEEEDLLAAMGYESLIRYDWDRFDMRDEFEEAMLWMLITGNGFWRIAWNTQAGQPVLVPNKEGSGSMAGRDTPVPEGEEEAEAEESPFVLPGGDPEPTTMEQLFEGDIDMMNVSPFNIDVPLTATSIKNTPWIAHHAYIDREVLVDLMGSKANQIRSGDQDGGRTSYDRQLRFDTGAAAVSGRESDDQIRIIEFWEAPTKKHPAGRVITIAGDTTLTTKKNPYGGRYPFVHFGCNPSPGRFWFDGIVRELMPLQEGHNKALTRYHESMLLMGNPKVIADKETGIKDVSINDRPGEIIFKRRGTDLQFVPPTPPSPIHPQIMSMAQNSMQSITGVNDPLAGQNPPNVRAAMTVRFLQESGLRRFLPIMHRTETALTRAGRMILYLHKRYWSGERTIRALGTDAQVQVFHMGKADVERVMDVAVLPDSMKSSSPAAKQSMVIELLQYAPFLFQGQGGSLDVEYILRQLDFPAANAGLGIKSPQRLRAYGEHKDLEQGEPIEVFPFDDDMLHLEIHGAKLSNEGWRKDNPEEAGQLLEHYALHESQKMQKMMGAMVDIHGGSPDGPQPPGPPSASGSPPAPMGRPPGAGSSSEAA